MFKGIGHNGKSHLALWCFARLILPSQTDDEIVSDDADEKVGVYERDEDWVAMEQEMNEEEYTTASEDEKIFEPSKCDIRFV